MIFNDTAGYGVRHFEYRSVPSAYTALTWMSRYAFGPCTVLALLATCSHLDAMRAERDVKQAAAEECHLLEEVVVGVWADRKGIDARQALRHLLALGNMRAHDSSCTL